MYAIAPMLREYRETDYGACEALVNEAWEIDRIFHPRSLAELALRMYTRGSLLESNYRRVVEVDGVIAGFLFGFNEFGRNVSGNALFSMTIVGRILCLKSLAFGKKKAFLAAINSHGLNRSQVVAGEHSEIVLFVVKRDRQGKGYGKQLLSGFLSHCAAADVETVIVETNKSGASSFYEHQGFVHMGDFFSPLHEYAAPGGQACIYRRAVK